MMPHEVLDAGAALSNIRRLICDTLRHDADWREIAALLKAERQVRELLSIAMQRAEIERGETQ